MVVQACFSVLCFGACELARRRAKVSTVFPVVTVSGGFQFGGLILWFGGSRREKKLLISGVFESLLRGGRAVSPYSPNTVLYVTS